jgi:hypothetical protein
VRAAFKPGLSASKDLAQEKPWVDVRQREIQYSKIAREGVYAEGVDRYHQEGVKKQLRNTGGGREY